MADESKNQNPTNTSKGTSKDTSTGDAQTQNQRRWPELSDPDPIAPDALAVLIEDLPDRALRVALHELSQKIAAGETPDVAVESLGNQIPDALRGFVMAGIRTGRLTELLEHYLRQRASARRLWRSLWAKIAYPLLIVALTFALMLLLLVFLVPMFGSIYDELEMDIPSGSTVLVRTSVEVQAFVLSPWAPGLVVILLLAPLAIRTIFGQAAWDGLRRGIPIVGGLWGWACLGEFARVLSLLVRYQVPLPEALRITGAAMRDHQLAQVCRDLSLAVEEGRPLSECIEESSQFPASLAPIASWGLQQDSLPAALDIVGDMCEERVRLESEWLKMTLPPIALIVVAWGTIATFMLVLIPLLNVLSYLS